MEISKRIPFTQFDNGRTKRMREIDKIIIHCTATPDYNPTDVAFDRYSITDIERWHKAKGWDSCGYHYVIKRSGKIQRGRPDDTIGAHCKGHNSSSIGVCYIGSVTPTTMQVAALYLVCCEIMLNYSLSFSDIFSHNSFNLAKTCPGFNIDKLLNKFWEYRSIPW